MQFHTGDVVLMSFPFTDGITTKKRPAVVVSTESYNQARFDLIAMPVTSQTYLTPGGFEVAVQEWQAAGLLRESVIKPVVMTLQKGLVVRKLGHLTQVDIAAIQMLLPKLLSLELPTLNSQGHDEDADHQEADEELNDHR